MPRTRTRADLGFVSTAPTIDVDYSVTADAPATATARPNTAWNDAVSRRMAEDDASWNATSAKINPIKLLSAWMIEHSQTVKIAAAVIGSIALLTISESKPEPKRRRNPAPKTRTRKARR